MKSFSTVRDSQRGSQSYMEKRRGRREIEVTRRKRGGIKREKTVQPVINSVCVLHSLDQPEMFMELYREEKREEGDRGDQEQKRENQKRREQASQYSLPYVLSTVWIPQRHSQSYTEKRRGRNETEVARGIKGGIKRRETDPASNQFSKCSPQPGTHKEIHRVGQRREGERRRQRRPGRHKGESKGGESNQASNLIPK